MKQMETLVVGASVAGLASAAALQKHGIDYLVIEKQAQVAAPWRNHYDRLHLHTNKRISSLPGKKFDGSVPRYPSRQQVVDYLEAYQRAWNILPVFDTEATSIRKAGGYWITETTNGPFQSTYLVMATGRFGKPRAVSFRGMETFTGRLMHSSAYKTGKDFKGQQVLVVGFGNSACEIAVDLYEQGAVPSISVRSPVNVIPRDLLGIPILEISLLMSRLPPRLADAIAAPLMRLRFGDIAQLGLKKMPYGPFEEIQRDQTIPVLDIGTIGHLRKGHVRLYGGIEQIEGATVHFSDGKQATFDAIVAAIGYETTVAELTGLDNRRLEDLKARMPQQRYFGKDGLYFCGFSISPTGQIREIASDAQQIACDIAKRRKRFAVHP